MLEIRTPHLLESIEPLLRRAASIHGATVAGATHVGHLLSDTHHGAPDAIVFTICHSDSYAGLLASDPRFAAVLPCRIAAVSGTGAVRLIAVSPSDFPPMLNRPDLASATGELENVLLGIMQTVARTDEQPAHAAAGTRRGGVGATEDQVNLRGSVPQRIDRKGTKVEDLGGTGEHDAHGG